MISKHETVEQVNSGDGKGLGATRQAFWPAPDFYVEQLHWSSMKKDIENIMEELAKGSDKIIVNPETLEELKSQGIPFDIIPSPTIGELFDQRKEKAYILATHLPNLPHGLPVYRRSLLL